MRLVCPNCDAEYEVDDSAIPLSGRDVQCSNCGHAWFQLHPETVVEAGEPAPVALSEALDDEPAPPEPEVSVEAAPLVEEPEAPAGDAISAAVSAIVAETPPPPPPPAIEEAPAEAAPPRPVVAPIKRSIDESVLSVLREEAEREAAARKAEAQPQPIEVQTEFGLTPLAEPPRKPVAEVETSRPRSELLPAIDEIKSTLRPSSVRGMDEAPGLSMPAPEPQANGFRRGFLTLVLLAVILLALYIFAPLIAQKVPALAGIATSYVAGVDGLRIWLDSEIRGLIGLLRGMEGGSQG